MTAGEIRRSSSRTRPRAPRAHDATRAALIGDVWQQGLVTETHALRLAELEQAAGPAAHGRFQRADPAGERLGRGRRAAERRPGRHGFGTVAQDRRAHRTPDGFGADALREPYRHTRGARRARGAPAAVAVGAEDGAQALRQDLRVHDLATLDARPRRRRRGQDRLDRPGHLCERAAGGRERRADDHDAARDQGSCRRCIATRTRSRTTRISGSSAARPPKRFAPSTSRRARREADAHANRPGAAPCRRGSRACSRLGNAPVGWNTTGLSHPFIATRSTPRSPSDCATSSRPFRSRDGVSASACSRCRKSSRSSRPKCSCRESARCRAISSWRSRPTRGSSKP